MLNTKNPRMNALKDIRGFINKEHKAPAIHEMMGHGDMEEETELDKGIKKEMEEHGMDEVEAKRTAEDHLNEDPQYYSKMEEELGETSNEQAMEDSTGQEPDGSAEDVPEEEPIKPNMSSLSVHFQNAVKKKGEEEPAKEDKKKFAKRY